jgi:hypothetical protein
MLWYLANGSLNEYLKSQVELQGEYYSGQQTSLTLANFSANTGIATFENLTLNNFSDFQAQHVLTIDAIQVQLSANQQHHLLTEINEVAIGKVILNIELDTENSSNVNQLIQKVRLTLAQDYPQHYPQISAKIYAEKHPELNAEAYAQEHPQTDSEIKQPKQKKKRGKPQQKVIISTVKINTLELNTYQSGEVTTIQKNDVVLGKIGGTEGLVMNQIGGEFLLNLFDLVKN